MEQEITPEFASVAKEYQQFKAQMNDPLVVGTLLNSLSQERRTTNLLLKEINAKLERISGLEGRIGELEAKLENKVETPLSQPATLLSQVDSQILQIVAKAGKCCAADIQKQLHYKGKNAASSRLNALWKAGRLDKKYAGKTVYFVPKV